MSVRTAQATWEGTIKEGKGTVRLPNNTFEDKYDYTSRFANGSGSSPEELLAAAEAECFSMALTEQLTKEGHAPKRVDTTAKVHLDKVGENFKITSIELDTRGNVPGIDNKTFQQYAESARRSSLICQVMSGANIKINTQLQN